MKMSDIMSISRLRMGTDGKGVTTLVGFYGCPLKCKYCINKQCHENVVRADYTPKELIEVLKKDEIYYLMTGGGVTFGGGEPLLQAEYIHEVCSIMNKSWRKTVETSLNVPWKNIKMLVDDIDCWYIDIKDLRNDIYEKYTGNKNRVVLKNLKRLVKKVEPEKICIRIPHIPDFNTMKDVIEEMEYVTNKISEFVEIEIFEYIRC